ncbi:molybdopterin molybdotransferase MoeA [Clostridium sardiniense]|uniref:molybdopterin molybdotransferase MoeA n=1 Tax=Clostridium sardiniense TaxID=29369 RepID=UPI0019589022|nr:molybdopterin molybdotransferase MoeA [Clostridium sardiniense]MBM7834617.1 molybdopterin molybdotransferase [Clostridium sardiniense]
MISLEEARELLFSKLKKMDYEEVSIEDSLGRVLYEDIYSEIDNPPFPRSPLDGYAVRGEDTKGASKENPIELKTIDKIYAGYVSEKELGKGEAIRIMTGAPIPNGADCIIRQEDTLEDKDSIVKIYKEHNSYDNYCYKGEDFKIGTKLLKKDVLITSSEIMCIASLGIDKIKVYKRPVVGILNTGDEIQNPGTKLKYGKIYNSNGYFLKSRLQELGCESIVYSLICDEDLEIIKGIEELEENCDIIISTGGVSVGEKDRVRISAEKAGYEILFWKIDMKPGSPMFGAHKDGKVYIGLSGTPVAAATSFELTCREVIGKMLSSDEIALKEREAILMDDFNKVSNKRRFLRVNINSKNEVHINNVYQTPGQVHTMINSNAILEVRPNTSLKKGDKVKVLI